MIHERESIEWSNFWWEDANKESERILLIGDSVTRGYRSLLNNFFQEYGYVIDLCAFSAAITDTLTEKMFNAFFSISEYSYEVIGMQLGGQHGFKKLCCADMRQRDRFKKAYQRYVSEMKNKCQSVFLISYTPTVLKENLDLYNTERNKELLCRNEIAKEVAAEMGCLYIDLWNIILDKNLRHTDYIHFDKEANQYIADYIGQEIIDNLKIDKGI